MTRNMTARLASSVIKVQFADLPFATVHKAKMHLLDTLGAALAGSRSEEVKKALCLIAMKGNKDNSAPIWGHDFYVSPRDSALINGIAAHAFELDDCGGCDHSGAVVVPALLAVLPTLSTRLSGKKLLVHMVMGYEVARRVLEACGGYELHNGLGWHSTGTCGVFGAAIAAGLMIGLGETELVSAVGNAGSSASGTWNFIHDGSQTKKLHAGRAAESGVMAALLAKHAFQGASCILEPNLWGSYFSAFAQDKVDAATVEDNLLGDFGVRWRLDRCSIKPYATCRGTHSAIDALEILCTRYGLDKGDIAAINVQTSAFQAGMCGGKIVETRAQAQMSLPYALAAKLTYDQVFLGELEEKARNNKEVTDWIACTHIHVDASMAAEDEPEITLILHDGQRFSACVKHPSGSPHAPLSDEKIIAKFIDLTGHILKETQIQRLVDTILNIDQRDDIRSLPWQLGSTI